MSTRKSMPGLSDSVTYAASNELANKILSTVTTWEDDPCRPSQPSEAHALVAVRSFSHVGRARRSKSFNCVAP
jgi:hypothetical protein